MVNMDLGEIKSVLLVSYQIFKITVEQYWHRLRCFISAYTSGVEDKQAYFNTVGVKKGSVTIQ